MALVATSGCWTNIPYTGEYESASASAERTDNSPAAEPAEASPQESRDPAAASEQQPAEPLADEDLFSGARSLFGPADSQSAVTPVETSNTEPTNDVPSADKLFGDVPSDNLPSDDELFGDAPSNAGQYADEQFDPDRLFETEDSDGEEFTSTDETSTGEKTPDVDDSLFNEPDLFPSTESTTEIPAAAEAANDMWPDEAAEEPHGSQRAAWQLGASLCLLALLPDRPDLAADAPSWRGEAERAASELGIELPAIPERQPAASTEEFVNQVLPLGKQVGPVISQRFGREHVALFEVSFKASLLLVLYTPKTETSALASVVRTGGQKSNLPEHLWQPLLDTLDRHPPRQAVDRAVFNFHAAVDEFLTEPPLSIEPP